VLKFVIIGLVAASAWVGWMRVRRPQRGSRPWVSQVLVVAVAMAWVAALVVVALAI